MDGHGADNESDPMTAPKVFSSCLVRTPIHSRFPSPIIPVAVAAAAAAGRNPVPPARYPGVVGPAALLRCLPGMNLCDASDQRSLSSPDGNKDRDQKDAAYFLIFSSIFFFSFSFHAPPSVVLLARCVCNLPCGRKAHVFHLHAASEEEMG